MKNSIAPTIEGAFGCGALIFGFKPFLVAAVAVVAPKVAIKVLFCLKSGKFLMSDSMPPGLKNTKTS